MDYQEGYVYHIKDEYFLKANDPNLMQNKENGKIDKYGNCLTIVMGEYDGKQAAFLLQNMFPITEKYLDHIHTRNNNPVPVKHSIQTEISTKMKRILQLHARGKKIVFPDISTLESLMLKEITSAERS
jgi:hypothetical protein